MRFILFLALTALSVDAATFYCGPTSAGGNTGADFSNRIALPDTTGFNRGDTYVIIGSGTSYGNRTLSEATSTTVTVTIRKANAAQDSGVAGWDAAFESTQARFATITIKTRYWIVDGITRTFSNSWSPPTGVGIRADQLRMNSGDGDDADFSIFRYIDAGSDYEVSPSDPTINGYDEAVYMVFNQSDITFSYCTFHNALPAIMQAAGAVRITVEYCWFGPGWGKEAIRGGNGNADDWIIRYNRFWNSTQTNPNDGSSGITGEIAFFGHDLLTYTDNAVYGNWFFNDKFGGRNGVVLFGGVGFNDTASGTLVYNNTFEGIADSAAFGMIYLSGSGNVARNNLFSDCASTSISANTASDNDTVGDIFVDNAAHDYRLSEETSPGFTLSAPYDTDPLGNARGSSGVWSVGAFQFNGSPPVEGGAPSAYGVTARVGSIRSP